MEWKSRTLGAALIAFLLPAMVSAQPAPDPDWPCVQRKVQHLSIGAMWAGPPIPEELDWRSDEAVALLASRLAARRTDLETVDLGKIPEADRLVMVFAGAFEIIDKERSRIIEGIGRFARKQRGLAEQIDLTSSEIHALEEATAEDDYDTWDRIEEMQDRLAWDIRIYQDRQRSLTYVCESPVLLEKRAFALARMIGEAIAE